MRRLLNWLDRWIGWPRRFMIHRNDGRDYLERWTFLDTRYATVKLQRIICSDGQHPHDHPYTFISIILVGSYTEERYERGPSRAPRLVPAPRWSMRRRRFWATHRVIVNRETWTLFVGGPRRRGWGFHIPSQELPGLFANRQWRIRVGNNVSTCHQHVDCAFVPWQFYVDVPFAPSERI